MKDETLHKNVTFERLRAFLAVAEHGSITRAGKVLEREPSGIRIHVRKLEDMYGGRGTLIEEGTGMLTPLGAELCRRANEAMSIGIGISRLGSGKVEMRFLPQHGYLLPDVLGELGDEIEINVEERGERYRASEVWQAEVIAPVKGGAFDLVIGPPADPEDPENLKGHTLYTSRLEAMVPLQDQRTEISVLELASRPLLLPPAAARSHQILARILREEQETASRPATPLNVSYQFYETKLLMVFGTHPSQRFGTVVLPSDLAYPWQARHIFGGAIAENFKWVPVVRADGRQLTHKVNATTRSDPHPNVQRVIKALRAEVKRLGLDVTKPADSK